MKLLGWDTSSKTGAIVALEWEGRAELAWHSVRLVAEWSLNVEARHSERLLWALHQVLESARWKLADLDLLAVGLGPGSFTGLRIGITTARTLGQALQKPLLGVSSLAALARPAALSLVSRGFGNAVVVASTDACKGELFALWGAASAVVECVVAQGEVEERVMLPSVLMDRLAGHPGIHSGWSPVGEGRRRFASEWGALSGFGELVPSYPFPDHVQGRYLGMLAFEAWSKGFAREALGVHPRYLRASDAEVRLQAGMLKKLPAEPTQLP